MPAKTQAIAMLIVTAFHVFHFLCSVSHTYDRILGFHYSPVVYQDLGPGDQAQCHEDLGLDLDRDVEVLHDCVCAERDATCGYKECVKMRKRIRGMTERG